MGIPGRNRIAAFACVVCPVCCDAAEFLIWRDLIEQIRQHGRVPNAATRDLDCPYLQRFLIDPNMYLAPQPPFGPTVLAGIPLITRQAHPQDAAERAPSPSALIPVLSTSRCSGPVDPL
jgi:hypothetical protein